MARRSESRVLMLVHVDWRWIKQRPHFLAEEARRSGHRVVVGFKPNPRRWRLPRNPSPVRRLPLLPVPHAPRHGAWSAAGRFLQRGYVWLVYRGFRPDVVYVSHPLLWAGVPRAVRRCDHLIYDCMDDAIAMADPRDRAAIEAQEAALVARSVVLATSAHLVETLRGRYPAVEPVLVRNGLSADLLVATRRAPTSGGPTPVLTYIGTIASWLDWDALERLRDHFGAGSVRLVGPLPRSGSVPDGILTTGPVEHARVADLLLESDLLLLPFVPSDLVNAVDPVKMYEYVASRRPILARHFDELDQFRDFATFYADPSGVVAAAIAAMDAPAPPDERVEAFLSEQLWSTRWSAIEAARTRAKLGARTA